ncbi:MAG TPA: ribose 5-phosphate isomerase B [Petrotogaceae bacterium]|jgi:ribose 5-phosphate isomerase B|nr:ribose 5-phosphate isomerase B [Petrotogaceae bacterium]HNY36619.1 ribose 5-phosphate isomerase B [Petrotogaceae bacterium]HPA92468.1 ribose 5-phosphate isomerase B [Petrotogaceae bacterium]HPG47804.1 ribose 5-phosphate isomerase B [Petrotogaceae bacterium]HPO25854.1 ribose 5-phosphate isomerase B [Petrotogaceae bacterium]
MKVAIGSDHAGYDMKENIKKYLISQNVEVVDCGTHSDSSVDYPDYAKAVCTKVSDKETALGILVCGTGIGMSIAANKIHGIRAALCLYPTMAELSRKHNNANVLVLGGRIMGTDIARWTVDAFIRTSFEGGRHQNRLDKIERMEE